MYSGTPRHTSRFPRHDAPTRTTPAVSPVSDGTTPKAVEPQPATPISARQQISSQANAPETSAGTFYGTLSLTNIIGMQLNVNVSSIEDAFTKMRAFGKAGWTSGNKPKDGYRLPYGMHDTFDWSLIGASPATIQGTEGVWFRGEFYKRRDMAATTGAKKMPAAIIYSKGAGGSDDKSNTQAYDWLICFRGNGRGSSVLCKKEGLRNTFETSQLP
ncbi:MAG: single-stranded DNA-binding protein [Vulcanimicrobiaceae bacterium]